MSAVVTHSAGINWGQAIATGVSVLTGLTLVAAFVNKRVEKARQRNVEAMQETAEILTDKLGERVGTVETHLQNQDVVADKTDRRLWRIEESLMKARRRFFGR